MQCVMGRMVFSSKYVEILTPSARECDLLGHGVFADDQLKLKSLA